ncbi:hypothetical protein EMO91_06035 [Bifidobacterium myosotis]|uniref:Transcription regulator TrmB N-terminal domain-containing protein n=1 Tax=Bifidobacterium myosotis TaxID=1630166 RepID=A0A5M9ZLA6_9BIFI|nr:hypothetical protein EMO91_06035 [Bifidobacterium myosotis]
MSSRLVRDTVDLSEQERQVYAFIQQRRGAQSDDVAGLLRVGKRQAQKILARLVDCGLLRRVGAGRSTRYMLVGEVSK